MTFFNRNSFLYSNEIRKPRLSLEETIHLRVKKEVISRYMSDSRGLLENIKNTILDEETI